MWPTRALEKCKAAIKFNVNRLSKILDSILKGQVRSRKKLTSVPFLCWTLKPHFSLRKDVVSTKSIKAFWAIESLSLFQCCHMHGYVQRFLNAFSHTSWICLQLENLIYIIAFYVLLQMRVVSSKYNFLTF